MTEFGDPNGLNGRQRPHSRSNDARASQLRRSTQNGQPSPRNSALPGVPDSTRSSGSNSKIRPERSRSWLDLFAPRSKTHSSLPAQPRIVDAHSSSKSTQQRPQNRGSRIEPTDRHQSDRTIDRQALSNGLNSRLNNSSLNPNSALRSTSRSTAMPASPSKLKPNDSRATQKQEAQRSRRKTRLRNHVSRNSRLNASVSSNGSVKGTGAKGLERRAMSLSPTRGIARKRSWSAMAFLYGVRLVILGIGVGAIAGTLLSIWDPASRLTAGASQVKEEQTSDRKSQAAMATAKPLQVGQEMTTVKARVQAMAAETPQMMPGIFAIDSDTGAYLDVNGSLTFPAASTIKIPILVAFFQDVDEGKIRLDELLTLRPEDLKAEGMTEGSGELQFRDPGTRLTALEVATKMIIISDNTATNMLIHRLGGATALNDRFRSWGLSATIINNILPDLAGTNTTSPRDLTMLMARLSQGELVSLRSRDRLLDIMRRTVNNSLLPTGIDAEATIAHKTGTINSLLGDAGLVDTPNGKRYMITVLVKHANTDAPAQDLIQQVSRLVYQTISQPAAAKVDQPTSPDPSATPGASPAPVEDAGYSPQQTPPSPNSFQNQLAQP
jgi:beta-lactamase class A